MNLIITNIGRRGYLVDYFKSIPGMIGRIYTADCDITASGLYGNNDGHFILSKPVDDERRYIEELVKVCKDNSIDAVVPVIDPEIYILSGYKDLFDENGIQLVVSDRRVLDICFDKLNMNRFLEKIGVAFPVTYVDLNDFNIAFNEGKISFPVVLKPNMGSGSVETYIVENYEKLKVLYYKDMLIQERLDGVEFGSDTFNNFDGTPLRCVIKKKISMRSGETDKAISVHNEAVQEILIKVANNLHHIGNLDADVMVTADKIYVIDLNPRFGGGYPATHAIGVNLVEVLWKLLQKEQISPEFGNYDDNIVVMKEIAVKKTIIKNL